MSGNTLNPLDNPFEDSFDDLINETMIENKDIYSKLFSKDFEDESILTELSTEESLPKTILNFDNYRNRDNTSNRLYFDYISGLINVMKKLCQIEDEIIKLWICSEKQTENCIFGTIFRLLPNCYIDICLPKVVDLSYISNNIKMSFYESLALSICQLIITLTKNHFEFVEQFLFRQLLSEQSVCSILASDVLCFTARISKNLLCFHFCCVLLKISSHINDSKLPNISSLLNRLLPFLSDIELGYLLEDYDLITHSRVWRIPNIFQVLSKTQIKECYEKFKTFIESGKPLTKYNINVLRNLFTTDVLDSNSREYCFDLFWKHFITLMNPNLYTDFIDIITVLLPNHLNESFLKKMFNKFNEIFSQTLENEAMVALDMHFIEKLLVFLICVTISDVSNSMDPTMSQMISSYIIFIHKNSDYFYAKYLTLNAMKTICSKSKHISILHNCCKDREFKEDFVSYLQKLKTNQVMDTNENIDYLQTIESKLRNQSDFKTNGKIIENKSQSKSQDISYVSAVEDDISGNMTQMEVESNNIIIDVMIDDIKEKVLSLRQNQSLIKSNHKSGLTSIWSEFKEIIKSVKD